MSTSIGRLRYKVALQSATNTSDGAGGVTESWDTIANIYADITPTGGDESFMQGKVQEKVTHKIFIRYRNKFHRTLPPSLLVGLVGLNFVELMN